MHSLSFSFGGQHMKRSRGQNGFTLIEVIVVMVILGLFTVVGMPAFKTWTANMHIRGAADDLRANMQRMRVEAIKQNADAAIGAEKPTIKDIHPLKNPGKG